MKKKSVTRQSVNKPIHQLLQGKWQSVDDKTNLLVFEGKIRKETAEGMEKWDEEEFELSDQCMNTQDKNSGIPAEKNRFISCLSSNLCWYIVYIDENNLELSYMGRGNSLFYKRAK